VRSHAPAGLADHHAPYERTQQADDRRRIPGGLDHHLVIRPQPFAERNDRVARELDPSPAAQLPILDKRCHREAAVHVQADDPHVACLLRAWVTLGTCGQHDTYGSALAAQLG
jgi:hypothetical protein